GGPYIGAPGVSLAFSGAGSFDSHNPITSYFWDFGDGTTSTLESPSHAYAQAGKYTVTLTLTNSQGYTNSAKTKATIGLPITIWDDDAVPNELNAVDSNPVELGVKFRSDVTGTIRGIRFYKGPNNTGTHVGSLWTRNGQLLAQATFTAETATG